MQRANIYDNPFHKMPKCKPIAFREQFQTTELNPIQFNYLESIFKPSNIFASVTVTVVNLLSVPVMGSNACKVQKLAKPKQFCSAFKKKHSKNSFGSFHISFTKRRQQHL